jgi:hypothetical protein
MTASEFSAKNETIADSSFGCSAFTLDMQDEMTVATVLKLAKTKWPNGEGVDCGRREIPGSSVVGRPLTVLNERRDGERPGHSRVSSSCQF